MLVSDVEDCAVAGAAFETGAVAEAGCGAAAFDVVLGVGFRFAVCGAFGVDREADRLPPTAPVSLGFAEATVAGGALVAAVVPGAVVLPSKNALVEMAASSMTPPPTTSQRGTSTVLLISTSKRGRCEWAFTPDLPVGAGRVHDNARRIAQCFSFEWSDGWLDAVDRTAMVFLSGGR